MIVCFLCRIAFFRTWYAGSVTGKPWISGVFFYFLLWYTKEFFMTLKSCFFFRHSSCQLDKNLCLILSKHPPVLVMESRLLKDSPSCLQPGLENGFVVVFALYSHSLTHSLSLSLVERCIGSLDSRTKMFKCVSVRHATSSEEAVCAALCHSSRKAMEEAILHLAESWTGFFVLSRSKSMVARVPNQQYPCISSSLSLISSSN